VIECNNAFEVLLRNQARSQSSQSEEFLKKELLCSASH
jgi:hypothetical protein